MIGGTEAGRVFRRVVKKLLTSIHQYSIFRPSVTVQSFNRETHMPNPVVHFEICVKDGAKGAAFYSKLFGWEIQHMPEMNYHMVGQQEGQGIGGGIFYGLKGGVPAHRSVHPPA